MANPPYGPTSLRAMALTMRPKRALDYASVFVDDFDEEAFDVRN
jgi:hypothetical protein